MVDRPHGQIETGPLQIRATAIPQAFKFERRQWVHSTPSHDDLLFRRWHLLPENKLLCIFITNGSESLRDGGGRAPAASRSATGWIVTFIVRRSHLVDANDHAAAWLPAVRWFTGSFPKGAELQMKRPIRVVVVVWAASCEWALA